MFAHSIDGSPLERALRARLPADVVRVDLASRLLYSTDASIYQILPLAVVTPRDIEEAALALAAAAEVGAPVVPRGGGTGLTGGALGAALVLDFSRHMDRVLAVEPDGRWARVQPGVRLAQLNAAAAPFGLRFGPDPATLQQCTLGGMIGNNACGARSVLYGKTADHVRRLTALLPDGATIVTGPTPRQALDDVPGREGDLLRAVHRVLDPHRDLVRSRYPRIPRRVSGYNLDAWVAGDVVDLGPLLVGSEGTLAVVAEAEVGLVAEPTGRWLLLLGFDDLYAAADAVPALLPLAGLSALEILDDRLLEGARRHRLYEPALALVPECCHAVLLAEFVGEDASAAADAAAPVRALAPSLPGASACAEYADPRDQALVWGLRRAALGLLGGPDPRRQPVPFVEDTAAPPARLGKYLRAFDAILARHEASRCVYGHAGQGCLHIRVDLDLHDPADVRRMRAIATEVADLVADFGGSLSGEHGDGLLRSEFLERMFGPEILRLHAEVKRAFDPEGRLNPGKIVNPAPMDRQLRYEPPHLPPPPRTHFAFATLGGWNAAVERCNGMGVCRKVDAGTMCPSYMVLREEAHSTRGRANLLREAMRGRLGGWTDPALWEALDLCLGCKACATECPMGVDMARLKAEVAAQRHRTQGVPRTDQIFGNVHGLARRASATPALANVALTLAEPLLRRWLGLAPRRLPRLARPSFRAWWRRHRPPEPASPLPQDRPIVLLFDDTFHSYFDPAPLQAAVAVLRAGGVRIRLPRRPLCCGRAAISHGRLDVARRQGTELVRYLAAELDAIPGLLVVGLEPSCTLTLRDDLPDLLGDPRAGDVARAVVTFEQFVAHWPGPPPFALAATALYHGHCHEKALVGLEPARRALARVAGLEAHVLDSGCCGLAGSFGYEARHDELSRACAERALLPAVRRADPSVWVLAPGFSCRTQIRQLAERPAVHPAELFARALSAPALAARPR